MTGFFPGAPGARPTTPELVAAVVAALAGDAAALLRIHQASDVDGSALAQHHTLGLDPNQAAAGDHVHAALYALLGHTHAIGSLTGDAADLAGHPRSWVKPSSSANTTIVLATAETKDVIGDQAVTLVTGRSYTFRYRGRFQASVAATAADARVRVRAGGGTVLNSDAQVAGASVLLDTAAGGGARGFEAASTRECPGDLAAGTYTVAAFYDVTAGPGTLTVDQSSGARRELEIVETIPG